MCGVPAEKIIHVEGGISPTGQFDSNRYENLALGLQNSLRFLKELRYAISI